MPVFGYPKESVVPFILEKCSYVHFYYEALINSQPQSPQYLYCHHKLYREEHDIKFYDQSISLSVESLSISRRKKTLLIYKYKAPVIIDLGKI